MAAHRYWRLVGFATYGGGVLELTEARLYMGGVAVDVSANLTCTAAPMSGALADLQDGSTTGVVSWAAVAYRSSGFALTWDLTGGGSDIDALRLGAGVNKNTFLRDVVVQWSDDLVSWMTAECLSGITYPGSFGLAMGPTPDADPHFDKVVSLLHFDGVEGSKEFVDEKGNIWTPTGSAAITNLKSGHYSGVGVFPGAGSYISTPDQSGFHFAGDFTIELRGQLNTITGGHHLLGKYDAAPTAPFAVYQVGSSISFYSSSDGTTWNLISGLSFGTGFSTSGVEELCVSRAGNTWRTFRKGNLVATATASGTPVINTSAVYCGRGSSATPTEFNGWLDEVRLTNGVARRTASYTPSSAPFGGRGLLPISPAAKSLRQTPARALCAPGSPRPTGAASRVIRTRVFADVYNGGWGVVTDTVKEKNTPVNTPLRRRVVLIDERSGMRIRETWSDALTGVYEFRGVKTGVPYTVLSYDHLHNYRATAADNLFAEVLP